MFDWVLNTPLHRSSHRRCSVEKGVLRNFAKFTGKRLCQRLYFNKNAGLRAVILLKKSLCHRCFPVNFVKFLRTPFAAEHLSWLLLSANNFNLWNQHIRKMERVRNVRYCFLKKLNTVWNWNFWNGLFKQRSTFSFRTNPFCVFT